MQRFSRALVALLLTCSAALVLAAAPPADLSSLGRADSIADGVELYRLSDPALLSPPGPVSVELLRVNPRKRRLGLVLAQDTVLGLETVPDMARRTAALAAINAGFFLPTGEPAGLLKIDGELVSDIAAHRGAVALVPGGLGRAPRLLMDQVSARVELEVAGGAAHDPLRVDSVDSARPPASLVLFTPRFWTDTRTPCDGGTEFVLEGRPLVVSERREAFCTSAIPRGGAVLAAGPGVPTERLAGLTRGTRLRTRAIFDTLRGTRPSDWDAAPDSVGGVGLLRLGGQDVTNWAPEQARAGFATERHPRTVIGTGVDGSFWLITVDGRNKDLSLGMSFTELQALARRVGLVDALNLDGGGSTTMVVKGVVVNHPSDPTGPRKVSDAVALFER